jgi:hypothetical protein
MAPWIPQSAEFAKAVVIDEAADRGSVLPELDAATQELLLSNGIAEPNELVTEGAPMREPGED